MRSIRPRGRTRSGESRNRESSRQVERAIALTPVVDRNYLLLV